MRMRMLCKYQSEYPQTYPARTRTHTPTHRQSDRQIFTTRYLFHSGRTRSTYVPHSQYTRSQTPRYSHKQKPFRFTHVRSVGRSIGQRLIYLYIYVYKERALVVVDSYRTCHIHVSPHLFPLRYRVYTYIFI